MEAINKISKWNSWVFFLVFILTYQFGMITLVFFVCGLLILIKESFGKVRPSAWLLIFEWLMMIIGVGGVYSLFK